MKDRIQRIIVDKQLTPSRFADEVGLNRPAVSHILNGRNNPGLDALQHIIKGSWLITGQGNMYHTDQTHRGTDPTLFDENGVYQSELQVNVKESQEMALNMPENAPKSSDYQSLIPVKSKSVKVKKIAIFYSDNTYEEFIQAEKE
jgi:transcriptional regulator with XRE-family HTH domain